MSEPNQLANTITDAAKDDEIKGEILDSISSKSTVEDTAFQKMDDNLGNTQVDIGSDLVTGHWQMEAAKQSLLDSKVQHWIFSSSDSKYMTAVKTSIGDVNDVLMDELPQDPGGFAQQLLKIRTCYGKMVEACKAYIEHITSIGRGKADSGKLRLQLVQQILAQSEKEMLVFGMSSADLMKDGKTPKSVDEILYNIRAEKLDVNAENIEVHGAGTSVVYRRQEADGGSTWIKAEENLAVIGKNESAFQKFVREYAHEGGKEGAEMAEKVAGILLPGSEAETAIKEIVTATKNAGGYSTPPKAGLSMEETAKAFDEAKKGIILKKMQESTDDHLGKGSLGALGEYIQNNKQSFFKMIQYVAKKYNEYDVATGRAEIDQGEAISNRNVSTSRLAERYGMSDIIASSKTMLIKNEDGTIQRANAMEGVEKRPDAKEDEGVRAMGDLYMYSKANGSKISFEPKAIRQIFQLQIFDLVCAQIDRHFFNYHVTYTHKKKENTLLVHSLKGIDNDLAFGNKTYSGKQASSLYNGPMRSFIDRDGRITVPFLSKDFFDKFMAYRPEMAVYEQADIRSKSELDALADRIAFIQKELDTLVRSGKIKVLETDEEWEEAAETLKKMKEDKKFPTLPFMQGYLRTEFI